MPELPERVDRDFVIQTLIVQNENDLLQMDIQLKYLRKKNLLDKKYGELVSVKEAEIKEKQEFLEFLYKQKVL